MQCDNEYSMDCGPGSCIVNVELTAEKNTNYRMAVWTGECLQVTVMCIPPCEEIGLEVHNNTEQYIRVEQGHGKIYMGYCKEQLSFQKCLQEGDAIFIPRGIWHNVVNTEKCPLKLSSVYSPPIHKRGTVNPTKIE